MEKTDPKISVIMGVYNQWNQEALRSAVTSILNQTFSDFEFIIYDDGSESEAAQHINALRDIGDERIVFTGRAENNGLAFSLNQCIDMARGKYIARMDADDISFPNRLQEQYDFLESHTEYSWCGCNTELFDDDGVWGRRDMPEKPEYNDYLKYSPYVHPTVMYRKSLFDRTDSYVVSEDTLRCEDYELFMRLRRIGFRGYNIQKYLFQYREDKDAFGRRKMRFRIAEAKLRYRNYKAMGILWPKGWIYVLRPIVGGFVPNGILRAIKRKQAKI